MIEVMNTFRKPFDLLAQIDLQSGSEGPVEGAGIHELSRRLDMYQTVLNQMSQPCTTTMVTYSELRGWALAV